MISYTKGCYIGQDIIARIHFRGHVAKQLTGLLSETWSAAIGLTAGAELNGIDGKNAGRITSVMYSPKLDKQIALAFVRYDFLPKAPNCWQASLGPGKDLPFVNRMNIAQMNQNELDIDLPNAKLAYTIIQSLLGRPRSVERSAGRDVACTG